MEDQEGNDAGTNVLHPLFKLYPNAKDFNVNDATDRCKSYLLQIASINCQRPKGHQGLRETKCNCLNFLLEEAYVEDLNKAASYMVYFAGLKNEEQNTLVANLKLLSTYINPQDPHRRWILPAVPISAQDNSDSNEDGSIPHFICYNAYASILNIGRRKTKSINENRLFQHGLKGRLGANSCRGKATEGTYKPSLREFFEKLKREEGTPFAMRAIREETGMIYRDDNLDDVVLPPHMTKRRCYEAWCWSQGWRATKSKRATMQYHPTNLFEKRPHDDDAEVPLWPSGTEPKPICAWASFLQLWKDEYPTIKVRPRGADTCTDCLKLLNKFSSAGNVQSNENSEQEQIEQEMELTLQKKDRVREEMASHIQQYTTQRDYANKRMEEARVDAIGEPDPKKRRICLTIDMGQNMGLTNPSAEQPGDTYYFSPLTIFVFGVVDNSRIKEGRDTMKAYVWAEGEGKRGANNIASCLLKDYKARGFFEGPNDGSLTIIADNCGGQNKNEDVIRFHMWLVEAGYFPHVEIVFLVKGHTKNACDRLFNLLKHDYHKHNCETFSELMGLLNMNEDVECCHITPDKFFDFSKTLNKYYRPLKIGETNRSHNFCITSAMSPTTLFKRDDANARVREDSLLPTKRNKLAKWMPPDQRLDRIWKLLDELQKLTPPGIPEIKQVELYSKWRPLLKLENQDITCPRPPTEVLDRVRSERRNKQKNVSQQKKIQTPLHPRPT